MSFLLEANALPSLAAAVLWGGGDFCGGMGVKRAGGTLAAALRIVLISHAASFSVLLLIAFARGDAFPHGAPLYWGLAAGVLGGLSLTCFYIALASSSKERPMGSAAAISGLLAAAIPAAISIYAEGSPGLLRICGFLVAGAAIWLIAAGEGRAESRTLLLAITAGAGFGLYFTALKFAAPAGIVWPMATARIGSLTTCSLFLLVTLLTRTGGESRISRTAVLWALSTAAMDTSGNLLFIAATRAGRLDIAAVLASLYPASTILLAMWMLHEHPTRRQALGMGIAAVAVAMISL